MSGRLKKWCPVPGCLLITHHINRLLQKGHELKRDGAEYRAHLKSAKRYTGLADLKLLLTARPTTDEQSEEELPCAYTVKNVFERGCQYPLSMKY